MVSIRKSNSQIKQVHKTKKENETFVDVSKIMMNFKVQFTICVEAIYLKANYQKRRKQNRNLFFILIFIFRRR